MACKAKKSMKRFIEKSDVWIEASSVKDYAEKLAGRMGGEAYEWGWEINSMLRSGMLVFRRRGGKSGYRTLNDAERADSVTVPTLANNNSQVVMA